jgi:diguanylate cyclase (GGDEF)-like protein
MGRASWLCRDDIDRARLLDMERRLKPMRAAAMLILAIGLVAASPWTGFWPLAPLAATMLLIGASDGLGRNLKRPEYVMFATWIGGTTTAALCVALAGVVFLPWICLLVITLGARFSPRGVWVGVAYAVVLIIGVAFATDAQAVIDDPPLLIVPVALALGIAVVGMAVTSSDVQHRAEAVIDPLTGMLNRNALATRVDELAQQSALSGQPVGMIVADVDNFKQVNDRLGHAAGDRALKDLAYVLRQHLRAFDLAYRIGGEEFLILVPGAEHGQCVKLAEILREAIAAETYEGGIKLTVSFGVSGSPRDLGFQYEHVFAAADAALYEAKDRGRNRVCLRDLPAQPAGSPSIARQIPRAQTNTAS